MLKLVLVDMVLEGEEADINAQRKYDDVTIGFPIVLRKIGFR
jgi:hypothetical protein